MREKTEGYEGRTMVEGFQMLLDQTFDFQERRKKQPLVLQWQQSTLSVQADQSAQLMRTVPRPS